MYKTGRVRGRVHGPCTRTFTEPCTARLKLAARAVLSADAGLLVLTYKPVLLCRASICTRRMVHEMSTDLYCYIGTILSHPDVNLIGTFQTKCVIKHYDITF